jgi:hypothetical protein
MTTLAYIAQQGLISNLKLERIIFALCRLQAWLTRDQVGSSKTLVYTLPGQSCTATLLPLIHRVFPCERHVFVYDGCVDSVVRGLFWNETQDVCTIPDSTPTRMSCAITASVPISPLVNAFSVSESLFSTALSRLPSTHAGLVEAWMSSVDTFIRLKTQSSVNDNNKEIQSSNKSEEYLPFVCRLGILLGQIGRLGNGDKDQSDLALVNILQYMTGSRSRPLAETIVSKAQVVLREIQQNLLRKDDKVEWKWKRDRRFRNEYGKAIEDCVFAHKKILLGDKTLMDTVQPMKEWTLLAAKKVSGCSCCLPGGDDEEEEKEEVEGRRKENEIRVETESSMTMNNTLGRSSYVDGKAVFAFDPTKFKNK